MHEHQKQKTNIHVYRNRKKLQAENSRKKSDQQNGRNKYLHHDWPCIFIGEIWNGKIKKTSVANLGCLPYNY